MPPWTSSSGTAYRKCRTPPRDSTKPGAGRPANWSAPCGGLPPSYGARKSKPRWTPMGWPRDTGSSRTGLLACLCVTRACGQARRPVLHRLARLPLAAGEIRELLRCAAVGDTRLTKRDGSAPGGGVVDIDIGRQSQLHALGEAVRHHVIHAAMAADFFRHLADSLPQRGLVFLLIQIERFEGFAPRPIDVDARRIIAEDALGAGDQVDAVVGLRAADVVLELDHAALHGADQADVEIAFLVDFLPARVAGVERFEGFAPRPIDVDARRIIAEDALGAGDQVDAVVGLRAADVVLQLDHAARSEE